jgi:hypothetical protein
MARLSSILLATATATAIGGGAAYYGALRGPPEAYLVELTRPSLNTYDRDWSLGAETCRVSGSAPSAGPIAFPEPPAPGFSDADLETLRSALPAFDAASPPGAVSRVARGAIVSLTPAQRLWLEHNPLGPGVRVTPLGQAQFPEPNTAESVDAGPDAPSEPGCWPGAATCAGACADAPGPALLALLDDTVGDHPDLAAHPSVTCVPAGEAESRRSHGYMVAGCAAARADEKHGIGSCPGRNFLSMRITNSAGKPSTAALLLAIDFALRLSVRPIVFNLSLECLDADCVALVQRITESAKNDGVLFVVPDAQVNRAPCTSAMTPLGEAPGVLLVGGLRGGRPATEGESAGDCVDVWAPATRLTTLNIIGGSQEVSGVSFATATVSGAAALSLANAPTGAKGGALEAHFMAKRVTSQSSASGNLPVLQRCD